jgi:hypothetical protein
MNDLKNNQLYGYIMIFDKPDLNGIAISKKAINLDDFEQMKKRGDIIDYEIDEKGIKITKNYI